MTTSPDTQRPDTSACERPPQASRRRLPRHLRQGIQIAVLAVTLAIGLQFALFVLQAAGPGAVTIPRPPGVEGFLPIGALMGWRLFGATGHWDPVHPAAMVILGFAVVLSLVLRKAFCGWFCPVGTLSEWLWRLGRRLTGRLFDLPAWLDVALRGLKYVLLGFFVRIIFTMPAEAVAAFLNGPYYILADVKMLHFFTRMSVLTAVVLGILTVLSLFVANFWCRYLCPYGALMGLVALVSPSRIERRSDTCIDCRRCTRECPHRLPVHRKRRILSPECSGCMACTQVCPVEKTLELKTVGLGRRAWSVVAVGVAVVGLFSAVVLTARLSGHWQTQVPQARFRALLQRIDSPQIRHPKTTLGAPPQPPGTRVPLSRPRPPGTGGPLSRTKAPTDAPRAANAARGETK